MEIDLDVFDVDDISNKENDAISEYESDDSNSVPLQINSQSEDEDAELQSCVSDGNVCAIDLHTCLDCNLQYQEMLTNVIAELEISLERNMARQEVLQEEIDKVAKRFATEHKKLFLSHPYPYFLDQFKMACPANDDAKAKQRSDDFDAIFWHPTPNWLQQEEKKLCTAVVKNARKSLMQPFMQRKEILSEKLLSQGTEQEEKKMAKVKLKDVNIQLENIKNLSIEQLFSKDIRIDWMSIANVDMNNVRKPEAYELRWKNYLSPKIKRVKWTKEEDASLKKVVEKFDGSFWYMIASSLKTGRSALQCFQRYHCVINPVLQKGVWSEEEKKTFHEVVEMCRYGDFVSWVQVHYFIEGRSLESIRNYWYQKANPLIKHGFFTREEDYLLLSAVKKFGFDWKKIVACFNGSRTRMHCRQRYMNCLRKTISFQKFTGEEDWKLMSLVKQHGCSWKAICSRMPDRTKEMIVERYNSILTNNPNLDQVLVHDGSEPLAPTHHSLRCERYRDDLHKLLEARCAAFANQNNSYKRKRLTLVPTSEEGPVEVMPSLESCTLALKEAQIILDSKGKKRNAPSQKELQSRRDAEKVVDGQVATMIKPLTQSHLSCRAKYTALTGKKLVQYAMTKEAFCRSLDVPMEWREGEEAVVAASDLREGISRTLDYCLGKTPADRTVTLPPSKTTVEGFHRLLSDLNRLAGSASSLTDPSVVTQLQLGTLVRQDCAACNAVETDCKSGKCPDCIQAMQSTQRFALLRTQFVAMFFWPALMSTVPPPDNPSVTTEEPEVAKTKTTLAKDQPQKRRRKNTDCEQVVEKKKRPSSTALNPARKSLRLAVKQSQQDT